MPNLYFFIVLINDEIWVGTFTSFKIKNFNTIKISGFYPIDDQNRTFFLIFVRY